MDSLKLLLAASAILLISPAAQAQFSPGPLSRAHAGLEGPANCTKCHEVGSEIAGTKCMECHGEIRAAIDGKTGYHALTAARQACVACHKEHLGLDARTYLFDPQKFDHDLTGFTLSGRHAKIECNVCHAVKYIRQAAARDLSARRKGGTYLGLRGACADCHSDVHRGKFGSDCSGCHRTTAWAAVSSFDHSRTHFPLAGRHGELKCEQCHKQASAPGGTVATGGVRFPPMPAESYADCTPCHASPHRQGMVRTACSDCHDASGWERAIEKPFPHDRTRYALEGGHARVRCLSCHPDAPGRSFESVFRRSFAKCTDCHADRHDGAFTAAYSNDCADCHTVEGYSPSTFSLERHQQSPWPLTGAHVATLCADCHRPGRSQAGSSPTESSPAGQALTAWTFDMKSTRCEACHADVHQGQFAARPNGCASCHSTSRWTGSAFEHGTLTAFPLEGKHAAIRCEGCHTEVRDQPAGERRFRKLPSDCASCHRDAHRGQFAKAGATDCAGCHGASAWTTTRFDHERSAFPLTGAHSRVRCESCHPRESDAAGQFTRYRPLAAACESCHQKGVPR